MTEAVTVTVSQGKLRGRKVTSITGVKYCSFQGVPFAKSPVGTLRFKAPEPPEPWQGTRDAQSEGPEAPQLDDFTINAYLGEEDCLYLNVFTPELPSCKEEKLKPVMVWIHGGGFYMGSGNIRRYGPEYIMAEDVLLVTFNYRLGPLGFLTTEDSETCSNNGMKDQVMALRWVQQNIAQFGGDPNNVTIFGVSAGASSVHMHLLSPLSKGLFHKAIAMSGVAVNPWSIAENPRDRAFRLGAVLGCKTTDSKKLVEFLRTVPARQLVESVDKAKRPEDKAAGILFFAPTLEEGAQDDKEVFLPGKPTDLLKAGKFHKVPFITGITSQEGMLVIKGLLSNPGLFSEMNKDHENLVPRTFHLKKKSAKSKEVAHKIKDFYFRTKQISDDTLEEIMTYYTDVFFTMGVKKTVQLQRQHSDTPIYLYQFSYDEKLGMIEKYLGTSIPGVCHGAEIAYLFREDFIDDCKLNPNTDYMKTVTKTVKLWTNFAKTGNPTPNFDPLLNVIWDPVTKTELNYLDIDKELTMKNDLAKDRVAFWEDLEASL